MKLNLENLNSYLTDNKLTVVLFFGEQACCYLSELIKEGHITYSDTLIVAEVHRNKYEGVGAGYNYKNYNLAILEAAKNYQSTFQKSHENTDPNQDLDNDLLSAKFKLVKKDKDNAYSEKEMPKMSSCV